jgi:hypothetical protein
MTLETRPVMDDRNMIADSSALPDRLLHSPPHLGHVCAPFPSSAPPYQTAARNLKSRYRICPRRRSRRRCRSFSHEGELEDENSASDGDVTEIVVLLEVGESIRLMFAVVHGGPCALTGSQVSGSVSFGRTYSHWELPRNGYLTQPWTREGGCRKDQQVTRR